MRIRIASRKSDLARIQALAVGRALQKAHPHLDIEYQFRESLGDKNLNDPLWQMPEKGVFTEDFHEDLLKGRADLVVHSWKDLPVEKRKGTDIAATLPRADMRDLLLMRRDRWQSVQSRGRLTIYSSSPRRAYNLHPFLKQALPISVDDIRFEPVRGNVPTRVRKLFENEVDGLIVAKAALDRLLEATDEEFLATQKFLKEKISQSYVMILPLRQNPTAAAQGALAIEVASDRADVKELLKAIHCEDTLKCVLKEREILTGYGGGCHQKVGVSVLRRSYGEIVFVRALTDAGEKIERIDFHPTQDLPPQAPSESQLFPSRSEEKITWFKRESLPVSELPSGPLWLAKAEALPEGMTPAPGTLVWASGWESWKKLARRGVWVTGCAESLGEAEDPRLEILFGSISWTKLTHDRVHAVKETAFQKVRIVPTYQLIPQKPDVILDGKTHFYWASGSSFLRALELFPQIRSGYHSCGPGNTYEVLRKTLGPRTPIGIFLNYDLWKKRMTR